MNLKVVVVIFLAIPVMCLAQNRYIYRADLVNINNDMVSVVLQTPAISEDEIIFSFPKVIPGSYSEKNFGKFIENFRAADANGKKLKVYRLNPNQFSIRNAKKLSHISYLVNDTWDKPDKDFIFQPGGSNIEKGKNVVMNNHAFYGYFEGYKSLPIELQVTHPDYMYASTHLSVRRASQEQDIIEAENYFSLTDNPIFYSRPDTSTFYIGNSKICVSVISATGMVSSQRVAGYLEPIGKALQAFFGELPVSSYQFLFYFEELEKIKGKNMGGFGALEHNYSSLYFLYEMEYESKLKSLICEVAAHEFLHILTPLNLHSEEIENFNYINPKMSKHLWLYEGVTEYFAHLTQLQYGLLTENEFFENMQVKINQAEDFGNFSLTEMSEHVLESSYKDKYGSVYNKGAITAMMLDISIRKLTNGSKDLKSIILTLSKKYGPGKPFKDDLFFTDFVEASHPDVQQFITDYIVGYEPLPYQHMFKMVGYNFENLKRKAVFFNGKMGLIYDEKNKEIAFYNVEKNNALDIKENDVWLAVNDTTITQQNIREYWNKYFNTNIDNPELTITVKRKGIEKILSGTLYKGIVEIKNFLEPVPNPEIEQKQMLNWLIKGIM